MNKLTPAEVAAFNYRLTGGKADPDAVGNRFLLDAASWDEIAEKALASASGKFRGVTVAAAREMSADLRDRAVSVPAELRKLLGA